MIGPTFTSLQLGSLASIVALGLACRDADTDKDDDDDDLDPAPAGDTGHSTDTGGPPDTGAPDDDHEVVMEGLVAYYPLDGDGRDSSGNGYDCTGHNGVAFGSGRVGQAAVFDGIDDFLSCGRIDAVLNPESFTLAAWILLEERAGADVYGVMSNVGPWRASGGYALGITALPSGIIASYRDASSNSHSAESWSSIEAGVWTHVAATVSTYGESTTMQVWFNGEVEQTEITQSPVSTHEVTEFFLGSNIDGVAGTGAHDREFQGAMDEVRVYNRVLSPAEFAELAAMDAPE
jgi:hypothetical protein